MDSKINSLTTNSDHHVTFSSDVINTKPYQPLGSPQKVSLAQTINKNFENKNIDIPTIPLPDRIVQSKINID